MAEVWMTKKDERERIETRGLRYKVMGDNRWHLDIFEYQRLESMIPEITSDVCPKCGNKENLQQNRGIVDYTYSCAKCKAVWSWVIDKNIGILNKVVHNG